MKNLSNPRLLDFVESGNRVRCKPVSPRRGERADGSRSLAHVDKAYGAAVSAVMGKAKILNLSVDEPPNTSVDFSSAKSMQDIGRKLLQSVGFKEPDAVSIQAAIELNDKFIDDLQTIHQRAQQLTLE